MTNEKQKVACNVFKMSKDVGVFIYMPFGETNLMHSWTFEAKNVTWRKVLMKKDSSSSTTAVKSVINNLRSQYDSNEHPITLDQIKLD